MSPFGRGEPRGPAARRPRTLPGGRNGDHTEREESDEGDDEAAEYEIPEEDEEDSEGSERRSIIDIIIDFLFGTESEEDEAEDEEMVNDAEFE